MKIKQAILPNLMLSGVLSLTGCDAQQLDPEIMEAMTQARKACSTSIPDTNDLNRFENHLKYPWLSRHEPTPRDEAMNFLKMTKLSCATGATLEGLDSSLLKYEKIVNETFK